MQQQAPGIEELRGDKQAGQAAPGYTSAHVQEEIIAKSVELAVGTRPEGRLWAAAALLSVMLVARPDAVVLANSLARIHDALLRVVLADGADVTADLAL